MDVIKEAYEKALKVLEKCETPHGFYAAYPGYDMIFARDSMIISLGASLINKKFKETIKQSLLTLAKHQSRKGQIPNAVDLYSKRGHHVDFKSIDSTLWFILGHYIYKERFKDDSLFNSQKSQIESALHWLDHQESGEEEMLEQLSTTDWQDAFPHKYGHVINTQALYHKVLLLSGKGEMARLLKYSVNHNKDHKLWEKEYYLPWRWKNHGKYQEKEEWFDSLGNLLAIIFDLTDKGQASKILNYIKKHNIDKPFPIKAIYPPIKKGDKEWHDYFEDCDARTPYHYLNAGIWTFIGGFYVLALIRMNKIKEAKFQLKRLAEANLQAPIFAEWLNGKTGKPGKSSDKDGNQGWNAGLYILAYESLRAKKVLL